jgi:four helix bundle protein
VLAKDLKVKTIMMHNDLEVYKSSLALVKQIYLVTRDFPRDEMWGLVSQMKRAAISVPTNIAEGCGRKTPKELANFLNIALGSLAELSTHIEIAEMLGFIKDAETAATTQAMTQKVKRQLVGLIKSVANT